jgi:threonine/homoserine/homoserine lactone efflux protein
LGNALGGLVHVLAAALGLAAILMASATAFTVVKLAGAAYLVYLGIRTLLSRSDEHHDPATSDRPTRSSGAFYQGIMTEILNPKTALFLLAFLPQFVNPQGSVVLQIVVLGCISVFLNTAADLVVAGFAGTVGSWLRESARLRRGQRILSGWALIGLGAYVALAGEKR